jgi:hypothetical protein
MGARLLLLDGDQLPRNRAQFKECVKIAWSLGFGVAKNGDSFNERAA